MACGTPVVAVRATAVPEVVGDAAVLAEPGDAGAFARARGAARRSRPARRAARARAAPCRAVHVGALRRADRRGLPRGGGMMPLARPAAASAPSAMTLRVPDADAVARAAAESPLTYGPAFSALADPAELRFRDEIEPALRGDGVVDWMRRKELAQKIAHVLHHSGLTPAGPSSSSAPGPAGCRRRSPATLRWSASWASSSRVTGSRSSPRSPSRRSAPRRRRSSAGTRTSTRPA